MADERQTSVREASPVEDSGSDPDLAVEDPTVATGPADAVDAGPADTGDGLVEKDQFAEDVQGGADPGAPQGEWDPEQASASLPGSDSGDTSALDDAHQPADLPIGQVGDDPAGLDLDFGRDQELFDPSLGPDIGADDIMSGDFLDKNSDASGDLGFAKPDLGLDDWQNGAGMGGANQAGGGDSAQKYWLDKVKAIQNDSDMSPAEKEAAMTELADQVQTAKENYESGADAPDASTEGTDAGVVDGGAGESPATGEGEGFHYEDGEGFVGGDQPTSHGGFLLKSDKADSTYGETAAEAAKEHGMPLGPYSGTAVEGSNKLVDPEVDGGHSVENPISDEQLAIHMSGKTGGDIDYGDNEFDHAGPVQAPTQDYGGMVEQRTEDHQPDPGPAPDHEPDPLFGQDGIIDYGDDGPPVEGDLIPPDAPSPADGGDGMDMFEI